MATKTTTTTAAKPAPAKPAEPANIAPVTEFDPSGAPLQTTDIDAKHAAVDDNPRADTTVDQNRIDFNEPSALTPQDEQVEQQLKAQG